MKKLFTLLIAAILAALSGCDTDSSLLPENELLVVRAYLYAGEHVTDVQVTTTFGLTSDDIPRDYRSTTLP